MMSKLSKAMLVLLIGAALNTQAAPRKYPSFFGGTYSPNCAGARYGRLASYIVTPASLVLGLASEHTHPYLSFACGALCTLSLVSAAADFGLWEDAGAKLQELVLGKHVKKGATQKA